MAVALGKFPGKPATCLWTTAGAALYYTKHRGFNTGNSAGYEANWAMTLVKGGLPGGPADRPEAWSPARLAARIVRSAAFLALAGLALAGCSPTFDKYFGTDKPPASEPEKKVATEQSTPDATNPPGSDKEFPNLGSVPQTRPVRASIDEQRQAITQGLVADRQNAKYTDDVIRFEPVQTSAPVRASSAAALPKLPGASSSTPEPVAAAKEPSKNQIAQAPAAKAAAETKPAETKPAQLASAPPPPPALPQPAIPTAPSAQQTASAPQAAPVPVAPMPVVPPAAGVPAPSAPPPPSALPQPPIAASVPPRPPAVGAQQAAPASRSNFTLGTAVAQALEQPLAPPPQSAEPAQAQAPVPVAPPATAASAPQAVTPPFYPPALPQPGYAQAPSVQPSGPAPTPGVSSASVYQPPQVPASPATMASVSQSKPPPPPLIPGQSPPPTPPQSAALPTTAPALPGGAKPSQQGTTYAPAYPQSATPIPSTMPQYGSQQMAAVPTQPPAAPTRPVLTPPSSYQQPGYQQPVYPQGQAAYPAPAAQVPATAPQQVASRSPIRPPPPAISPAMPALSGDQAAINEARWRTSYSGGQQVGLILFQNGSVSLAAGDRDLLHRVAVLARQSGSIVRVVGHASGRTGEMNMGRQQSKNLDISQARANAAAAELRAAGVPAERIVVEAKGDSEPVYRETMPSGEAGNRRVDVYLQ